MSSLNLADLSGGLRNFVLLGLWASIADDKPAFPWDTVMERCFRDNRKEIDSLARTFIDFSGLSLQTDNLISHLVDWIDEDRNFWTQDLVEISLSLFSSSSEVCSVSLENLPCLKLLITEALQEVSRTMVASALFARVEAVHNESSVQENLPDLEIMAEEISKFAETFFSSLSISGRQVFCESVRAWICLPNVIDRRFNSRVPESCEIVYQESESFLSQNS